MGSKKKKSSLSAPAIAFIACFAVMSGFLASPFTLGGLALILAVSGGAAFLTNMIQKYRRKDKTQYSDIDIKEENVANTKRTSERVGDPGVTSKRRPGKEFAEKVTGKRSIRFSKRVTVHSMKCEG